MAENIELAKFDFDVSDVIKNASKLKEVIESVKEEQKALKKSGDQNSTAFVENEAKIKTLNGELRRHQAVLNTSNKAKLDSIKRTERITMAISKEAVSVDQLRQKNKELNTLRNSANITTKEGRKELELINAQLDKNNEQIKENVDAYTQQKINIGNYQGALNSLSPRLSAVVAGAQKFVSTLKVMKTAIAGNAKGLKLFRIALISTGIGAIVVALGLLLGLFLKTQKATDALTRGLAPLQEIFQVLIGLFEKGGEALVNAFRNPQKALKDFGNLVKTNILNRIEGLIETFGVLGKVIGQVFSGEFEKAGETAKGLQETILKATTGVEDLPAKLKAGVDSFNDSMQVAIDRGNRMADLAISAEKQENSIILLRAISSKQIKEAELIAKDQLKTDDERLIAMNEALRLTKQLEDAELKLLDTKIEGAVLATEANDTDRETEKELNELVAQKSVAQQASASTEIKFLGTKKQLIDQANVRDKKIQTERIKGLKQEIELYVANQGQRALTLEEELTNFETLSQKKLEILEAEFKAGVISAKKLETEKQNIQNETEQKTAELLIDNASRELDAYRQIAENKLEIDEFLSEARLVSQQATLDELANKETEFLQKKLDEGLISQTEFNDGVNLINETNRIANEELQKQRDAVAKEEKTLLDAFAFEEQLELMRQQGASIAEVQATEDANNQALEIANLDKSKMSNELYEKQVDAIKDKYADIQLERSEILKDQQLATANALLSGIGGLVDRASGVGKAVALAQAGINTYQGVTKALAETTDGTPTQSLRFANAVAVGLTGLASVKKILQTKLPGNRGGGGSANLTLPKIESAVGGIDPINNQANLQPSDGASVQSDVNSQDGQANATSGIKEAIEQGAKAGTQEGSQAGITNLTDNRQIQQVSAF